MSVFYPRPAALAQLGPGHNVVESSAGTGKTFLLEHLFVDLLLTRGVTIDQVLVVTYTEKATAELVLRLRTLLAELADVGAEHPKSIGAATAPETERWLIDSDAKDRIRQALLCFDRANISTIHGFCQRILREHSFIQGRLFDESLVAEETVVRHAFRDLLRAHAGGKGDVATVLRAWLESGRTVKALEDLLCECAGKDAAEIRPSFEQGRLEAAMHAWPELAWGEAALGALLKQEGVAGQSVKGCVARIGWLIEAVAVARGNGLAFLAGSGHASDKSLAETLAFLTKRLPTHASDAMLAKTVAALAALADAVVPFDAAVVQTLLPLVRKRAAEDKRRTGTFDFGDMLSLVGHALDDDSPVRDALLDALRARYRFALIDEFQDTDETQWSIFRRIFVESPRGHALTVIGDPKQAIYGFRGANVAAYLEARRALCDAGAARLQLDRNFRSTADLVDVQNLLFDQEAGFFRTESGIAYDAPVSCGAPGRILEAATPELAAPVVVFALSTKEQNLRAADAQAALQATIVEEIRALVGADSGLRLRGRSGSRESLRPRDIFVLTFTNSESLTMGQALGRAGIPFAFYKRGKLFESPEADEVLRVLRAIAEPEDRSLVARALLTRFFDLDLGQAAAALDADVASEPMLRLRGWAGLARKGDVPGLFASLQGDSGILRREIFANGGERALTNTMHVFELLHGEWARTRATLPELIDALAAYVRGTDKPAGDESDVQRLETEKDAVQILTVHTAKGLEADVVFVYGGTGEPTHQPACVYQQRGVRVLHVGKLDDDAKRVAGQDRADERSRLLYVALTRARYRLYVPHLPAKLARFSGPYRQANDHLGRVLGENLDKPHRLFAVRPVDCQALAAPAFPLPSSPETKTIPGELLTLPGEPLDLAAIKRERSGFLVTSYSSVKRAHTEGLHRSSPEGEIASEVGRDRRRSNDELPGGAETGIFLHDVLATVPLSPLAGKPAWADWFASPDVERLLERLARRHSRPASDIAPSARMVHLAYTHEVRLGAVTIAGLAQVAPALREMEFLFPIPERAHPLLGRDTPDACPFTIERGVVKGFIDLLFEHQGRTYVCDWKSDSLPDYASDTLAEHCQQSYDVQARIYTIATLRLAGIATRAEFERRYGGVFFCFLRGLGAVEGGIHHLRPDWDTVVSWEREMLDAQFWGTSS
jgi:exodeoxyribonuclease V beta subunit